MDRRGDQMLGTLVGGLFEVAVATLVRNH